MCIWSAFYSLYGMQVSIRSVDKKNGSLQKNAILRTVDLHLSEKRLPYYSIRKFNLMFFPRFYPYIAKKALRVDKHINAWFFVFQKTTCFPRCYTQFKDDGQSVMYFFSSVHRHSFSNKLQCYFAIALWIWNLLHYWIDSLD